MITLEVEEQKLLNKAFENCNIIYKGKNIACCDFVKENQKIVSELLTTIENKRIIIMHPDSRIIFILSIVLSAFATFIKGNMDGCSIIEKLSIGDMVVYKDKKRGVYKGKDFEGRLIIESDCTYYVPLTMANKVKPYYGKATSLDGRGLKNNSGLKDKLLSSIFELSPESINNKTDCSAVIVCDKRDAQEIMEKLSIGFNGTSMRLSEVFPAAYYTTSDSMPFAGNSANLEPVLKFTCKLSVARELILEDRDKRIKGLFVNGSSYLGIESTELIGLLNRRALQSVVLLSEMHSNCFSCLKEQCYELELYAWTKKAIKSEISDIYSFINGQDNVSDLKSSYRILKNCLNKTISNSLINVPLEMEKYDLCRRTLYKILKNEYSWNDKEYFIIRSFSLLNLFEHACFPIQYLEKVIENQIINAISPSKELMNLENLVAKATGSLREDMICVVSILKDIKNILYLSNPKYEYLTSIIYDNYYNEKKAIIIIVPKSYYFTTYKEALPQDKRHILDLCEFSTIKKIDLNMPYDSIIFTGIFNLQNYNPFATNYAPSVDIMCYPFQIKMYTLAKRIYEKQMSLYDKQNKLINFQVDSYDESCEMSEKTDEEFSNFTTELEGFINRSILISTVSAIKGIVSEAGNSEIIRIATFETGEYVFFSKNYKPYILDILKGTVVEAEVSELNAGDTLVFTTNDNETKDVVEKIIKNLVNSDKCDKKFKAAYDKSIYWKSVFKLYIEKNNLTFGEVSKLMFDIGKGKHEVTLRTWLDEDSHIVGPRDVDSFYAIALLTGDETMLKNPDIYFEACNEVRAMRVRILRFIATSILNSYGKVINMVDELFASITGDVSKMSQVLQIEKIVDAENDLTIPSYMANRPHNF